MAWFARVAALLALPFAPAHRLHATGALLLFHVFHRETTVLK
jgi:hypothetical protein